MSERFEILRLGHQGDGIAEGPVFAPRTLPGEQVYGARDGNRLRDIRIDLPSADRVRPPCRHYNACGGCQLQHASDRFVADWKQAVVRSAIAAQGIETVLRPIHTSPAHSRRRATFAARCTKKGAMAGFHARGSDVIVQIPDCQLLDPRLLPGLELSESLAMLGASRKGEMAITVTLSEPGLDVAANGGKPLDGPLRQSLGQLATQANLARLSRDGEVIAMGAAPGQRFGAARVTPPPGAFLQATRDGEAALLAAVQEITDGAARIADLFAGCGTFSLPLAARSEILAVENDREMIDALDRGWRDAHGLRKVVALARDLFRRPLTVDELRRFDAIVLDPPRAGAEAQVAELAHARVPVVAYVSCNPVTFARDAKRLVDAEYALRWVQVVDQFRWSTHTELAACFTTGAHN